ncbi:unnamed protein product [Albugo candida]|uniref:Uncharacterized protein n=1 Tax=Albugo candida TaxID=65357 RepID=A0A024FT43_9STRA|nr:unnamed protein product [Albugo candida]|eukprot:CCI10260.1 unnamed protein product [Albugo candida]
MICVNTLRTELSSYLCVYRRKKTTHTNSDRTKSKLILLSVHMPFSRSFTHKKRNGTHHPTTHYYDTIPLKPTFFSASISGKFCFNKSKQFCGLAQAIFRISASSRRGVMPIMCTQHGCSFVGQFSFSQTFSPPTKFVLHSYEVSESSKASRRYTAAKKNCFKSCSQRYGHNIR